MLQVKDNGQGFDMESNFFDTGFGFLGIRERFDRINAQLTVHSQPGEGTEVIISINTVTMNSHNHGVINTH